MTLAHGRCAPVDASTARRPPLPVELALVAIALLPLACAAPPPPAASAAAPRPTRGYLVVSIDTLRADRLGCYGYAKPTSPFIDELARRGTLFEEAYSQYPSTLVSHMSIFTGLYPREHGVVTADAVLAPAIETFPQVFQRAGFHTAGFTEGGYVSGRYGFRRGFDTFRARDRNGNRLVEKTFAHGVQFLAGLPPGARFLLFLHTYAVHSPYDAPERYRRPFWPDPPPPGAIDGTPRALNAANASEQPLSPAAIDYLGALYDAGIRETDEALRGLFAELRRLDLADDLTVVVTADHGEELREHGRFHHTQLYREVMRVPLLVLHPDRRQPVRQRGVVQLVDLAPTLYQLAGLRPTGRPSGRSLAGLVGRPAPAGEGAAWAEGEAGVRALYRQQGAAFDSLLLFDPPSDVWLGRRLLFDVAPGELAFQARAFGTSRMLQASAPGGAELSLPLATEWTPVRVPVAAAGRVRLEVDGCGPPAGASRRDVVCYGFQVRGVRPVRRELYDLTADPGQRHDLAPRHGDVTRRLTRALLAFRPQPRAAGATAPLDAELAARLESLGYAGQVQAVRPRPAPQR